MYLSLETCIHVHLDHIKEFPSRYSHEVLGDVSPSSPELMPMKAVIL